MVGLHKKDSFSAKISGLTDVRMGSKAVLTAQKSDFRFSPVSGHPDGEEKEQ
jgi:hypothetical protein